MSQKSVQLSMCAYSLLYLQSGVISHVDTRHSPPYPFAYISNQVKLDMACLCAFPQGSCFCQETQ